MGSCISKCRPKKSQHHDLKEDEDHQQLARNVQDKLIIISQNLKTAKPTRPLVNPSKLFSSSKTPPSPSHSASSSSVSSFITCTASKASISTSSSISSSASSVLSSKDKPSFSNEFLWSCYKENPHIIRINSLTETNTPKLATPSAKQTCPQKRVRSNSPISSSLTRQKSFRRDQCSRDYYKCSALRSPSPSRRFANGEKLECQSKRSYNNLTFSRAENSRPASPNNSNSSRSMRPRSRSSTSTREQRNVHRISSKIDEIAVAEALDFHEIDNTLMEDIANPLISLDCFIFI